MTWLSLRLDPQAVGQPDFIRTLGSAANACHDLPYLQLKNATNDKDRQRTEDQVREQGLQSVCDGGILDLHTPEVNCDDVRKERRIAAH